MYSYTESSLRADPLEGRFMLQPVNQIQDAFMMYPLFIVERIPGTACYLADKVMVRRVSSVDEERADDFVTVGDLVYEVIDIKSVVVSVADMGESAFFDNLEDLVSFVLKFGWK